MLFPLCSLSYWVSFEMSKVNVTICHVDCKVRGGEKGERDMRERGREREGERGTGRDREGQGGTGRDREEREREGQGRRGEGEGLNMDTVHEKNQKHSWKGWVSR